MKRFLAGNVNRETVSKEVIDILKFMYRKEDISETSKLRKELGMTDFQKEMFRWYIHEEGIKLTEKSTRNLETPQNYIDLITARAQDRNQQTY